MTENYVCKTCGNTQRFTGYQYVTEYVTETIYTDGVGDVEDYGNSDTADSEVTETTINECGKCESKDIELAEVSKEEVLARLKTEMDDEAYEQMIEELVEEGVIDTPILRERPAEVKEWQ